MFENPVKLNKICGLVGVRGRPLRYATGKLEEGVQLNLPHRTGLLGFIVCICYFDIAQLISKEEDAG